MRKSIEERTSLNVDLDGIHSLYGMMTPSMQRSISDALYFKPKPNPPKKCIIGSNVKDTHDIHP